MKLENEVAIITGGSGGLGKAIAQGFLNEGAKIVIAARDKKKLEYVIKELKSFKKDYLVSLPTDISKAEEVRNLMEQTKLYYGKISILVNTAAIQSPIGEFAEIDINEAINNIKINFIGTLLCCSYALPYMIQNKKGKIINFSGGGSFSPRPNFSIYGSAKTALVRFSETLAEEIRKYGIDVNIIAPGSINTNMVTEILNADYRAGKEALKEARRVRNTGGTGVKPAVELAVFLASNDSKGITGRFISAPWDDWKNLDPKKLKKSSLYTLRRIDGEKFLEKNG